MIWWRGRITKLLWLPPTPGKLSSSEWATKLGEEARRMCRGPADGSVSDTGMLITRELAWGRESHIIFGDQPSESVKISKTLNIF